MNLLYKSRIGLKFLSSEKINDGENYSTETLPKGIK